MADELSNRADRRYNFFISFSSGDLKNVRLIMSAIKGQEIDFWDYSDEIQSIEAGKDIPSYLTGKIDESDYFVALISENSLHRKRGRFTRFEIDHAIKSGFLNKGKIILILLSREKKIYSKLKEVFPALEAVKHLDFPENTVENYVRLQEEICFSVKKTYVPEKLAHKRLPFRGLFNDEVYRFAHRNASHVALSKIIGEFNQYYLKEDWERAHFLIQHFISSCKREIPAYQILYPWIVKAVCEQDLEQHEEAEKSYKEALAVDPDNADALGGLGIVYLNKHDYKKAKDYFLKAESHSTGDQVRNEHFNYLMAKVSDNEPLSGRDIDFLESLDEIVYDDYEQDLIMIRKAILYFFIEKYDIAFRYFERVGTGKITAINELIFYLYTLVRLGKYERAEKFIDGTLQKLTSLQQRVKYSELVLHFARYYNFRGQFDRFNNIFKTCLLQEGVKNREILIEYAKVLYMRKKMDLAEKTCKEILDSEKTGLPKTKLDFYWNGFAHYMLGNYANARNDYEQSGKWGEYYDKLV